MSEFAPTASEHAKGNASRLPGWYGREIGLSEMRGLAHPALALSKPFREKMMRILDAVEPAGLYSVPDAFGR